MSATLRINKFTIKEINKHTKVPDYDIAKLMYYLNCAFSVISFNDYDKKLIDYEKFYNLTDKEKNEVIELCKIFKPQKFIDSHIFISDPGNLTEKYSNCFFRISDEKLGVYANREIVFGNRIIKTLKIMVFKPIWLDENYYTPLEEIEKKINNKKQIQRLLSLFQSTSESRSFYHRNTLPSSAISSPKKNFKLKIAIIICSIILILLILFLILYFSLKKKMIKKKKKDV